MTQIKKLGFGAVATALLAVLGMATLVNTAYAAHTFDAPNTATPGQTVSLRVTDIAAGANVIFERVGTSTATGFFLENNLQTLQCADGAACDEDADASEIEVQFFISGSSPAGALNFSASVVGGDTQTETTTVSAAAGTATSLVIDGPSTIINGTNSGANYTVYATDSAGNRVAVTGVQMNVNNRAVLAQDTTLAAPANNNCVALANANPATVAGQDRECVINTLTSSSSPARVGVLENGSVGETITISGFIAPAGGNPAVAASKTVTISGNAAAATIQAPTSVAAGSNSSITVNVVDSAGRPAGATDVTVVASEGVVVCPIETGNTRSQTTSGALTCNYIAPGSAQTVVITAVVDVPNTAADIVASATIRVTGTATPGGTPTPGECDDAGTFVAPPSYSDRGVGSAVFTCGSIAELSAAVTAAGGTAVWVQGDDGDWYRYNTLATGATAFVNNAFNAEFSDGFDVATSVFVVR